MNDVVQIIERMKQTAGVETDKALGFAMGRSASAVSVVKNKDNIPDNWFDTMQEKFGADPDFLRTGIHSVQPDPSGDEEPEATPEYVEEVAALDEDESGDGFAEEDTLKGRAMDTLECIDAELEEELPSVSADTAFSPICMNDIPTEERMNELFDRMPGIAISRIGV